MKTEAEIQERYNGLVNQWAAEYGAVESLDSMRKHFGKVGWIAALGWLLGKTPQVVAEEMNQEILFVHRENPSIVAHWSRTP